jgi:hypothetical protein
VESRSGNHSFIFTFSKTVTSVGSAGVTGGSASVSSDGIGNEARQYVVNVANVANAQDITIGLSDMTDSYLYQSSVVGASMGI